MPQRRIPSYRHHKSSDQAVVTLNGRDHYLGPWQSEISRSEYDRLIGEWLSSNRRLPDADEDEDLRVCELLNSYRKFARGYYVDVDGKPGQEFTCMEAVIDPIHQRYSRQRVRDFGPLALKALRQEMIDRGLCRKHINQRVNRIRRIFRWGVENELVPPDILRALESVAPLRRGRTTARESEPIQPVSDEYIDAVLPYVSRQVATMIDLQRLSGARPTEITSIRPCDVDQSGEVWVYTPAEHKTAYRGHQRQIYFGPRAQQILAPWLLRDPAAYCFSPAEAEATRNLQRRANRQTPMTPSQAKRKPRPKPKRPKRERYDRDSYRRAIEYGIKAANKERKKAGLEAIPIWTPRRLRHTCATRMRREYGLDVAQIILGHRSAEVTQVYAAVDQAKAVQVMRHAG